MDNQMKVVGVPQKAIAEEPVNTVRQSADHVRATILHISDLHFGRNMFGFRQVNPHLFPQLKNLVKRPDISPDYLVVSGDVVENPSPFAMAKAYRFICELAETAGVRPQNVLVIPGNHDYKMAGNVGLRRASRAPFEVYFRGDWSSRGNWEERRNWVRNQRRKRWNDLTRLSLNAIYPRGKHLRDSLVTLTDEDRGVVIFGLQSTPVFEGFATGKLTSEQLVELTNALETNRETWWSEAFKVAVVHHHPLPISYDSTAIRGRIEESLMVFYNAGGFLRELSRHGVDLILHGHKHVAAFRRAVYDFEDGTRRSVGVLAAGSATHKHPTDPSGNEFNVIRIYEDETVKIDRWYYSADQRRKDESRIYDLYDIHDVRARRNTRDRLTSGFSIDTISKVVTITRDGYSQTDFQLRNCQVCAERGLTAYELHEIVSERPSYVRGLRVYESGTTVLAPKILETETNNPWRIKANISFGEVRSSQSDSFDLKYGYRLLNGQALTFREFQRRYRTKKIEGADLEWEFSTVMCQRACEILKLIVAFPDDFDMNSIAAHDAVAYYFPRTPGRKDVKLPHDDETRRIKNKLSIEDHKFILEVASPIPEFWYRIRWRYREESRKSSSIVVERKLQSARAQLIKIANESETTSAATYMGIRDLLLSFLEDVTARYPEVQKGEMLDISLAIFDDKQSVLRFVAANFGSIDDLIHETLMTGEGCAGFCFEKGRVVYYSSRDPIGYYLDPAELALQRGRSSLTRAEALVAIPWMVPDADLPMGVVTISSSEKASRLLRLLDMSRAEQADETKTLMDLTRMLGEGIIREVWREAAKQGENA